jgi:uncharacterized membrane protein
MSVSQSIIQLLTIPAMKDFVNGSAWVWPVSEMIHYVGMSLIMGLIGILDLRILGLFKGLPIGALRPFVPLAVIGFIANLITGLVFVTGTPSDPAFYIDNLSFQLKMATMLIAGVNLAIFRITGLEHTVYSTPANASGPAAAKPIAAVSLICWLFVIFFGRLLMYNDTLLAFLGL